jgi:hypothetical protein
MVMFQGCLGHTDLMGSAEVESTQRKYIYISAFFSHFLGSPDLDGPLPQTREVYGVYLIWSISKIYLFGKIFLRFQRRSITARNFKFNTMYVQPTCHTSVSSSSAHSPLPSSPVNPSPKCTPFHQCHLAAAPPLMHSTHHGAQRPLLARFRRFLHMLQRNVPPPPRVTTHRLGPRRSLTHSLTLPLYSPLPLSLGIYILSSLVPFFQSLSWLDNRAGMLKWKGIARLLASHRNLRPPVAGCGSAW